MAGKAEIITEKKLKTLPAGGALLGTRKGQTIIHNQGSLGGYAGGNLHENGGIKGIVKGSGQPIEFQGEEIILTAPVASDTTIHTLDGVQMTKRQIASKFNVDNGGVAFAESGMKVPKSIRCSGKSYDFGGKVMTDKEIIHSCGCSHASGGIVDSEKLNKAKALIKKLKPTDQLKQYEINFAKTDPEKFLQWIADQALGYGRMPDGTRSKEPFATNQKSQVVEKVGKPLTDLAIELYPVEDSFARGGRVFGGNSGYVGYSMSVRAQQAYEDGKLTYSKLPVWAKRLVDAGLVTTDEWHHTSSYGNETPFYNVGQFDILTEDQKEKLGVTDWENFESFKNVPKPVIKEFDVQSKAALKIKNNVKEVRKLLISQAQKELNDFNKQFKTFSRQSTAPEHSIVSETEMNGKYGWFASQKYRYNLPEYFSGIDYETAENRQRAKQLQSNLAIATHRPIYEIELLKRGFDENEIERLKSIGIIDTEIMPDNFYLVAEKNKYILKDQLQELSKLPKSTALFKPDFNKTFDDFLTDDEKQRRQNNHYAISEAGEDYGTGYERKIAHENIDENFRDIARERYELANQEFLNSDEVKQQEEKFNSDKQTAALITGNIKELFTEERMPSEEGIQHFGSKSQAIPLVMGSNIDNSDLPKNKIMADGGIVENIDEQIKALSQQVISLLSSKGKLKRYSLIAAQNIILAYNLQKPAIIEVLGIILGYEKDIKEYKELFNKITTEFNDDTEQLSFRIGAHKQNFLTRISPANLKDELADVSSYELCDKVRHCIDLINNIHFSEKDIWGTVYASGLSLLFQLQTFATICTEYQAVKENILEPVGINAADMHVTGTNYSEKIQSIDKQLADIKIQKQQLQHKISVLNQTGIELDTPLPGGTEERFDNQ